MKFNEQYIARKMGTNPPPNPLPRRGNIDSGSPPPAHSAGGEDKKRNPPINPFLGKGKNSVFPSMGGEKGEGSIIIPYNSSLKPYARQMRNNSTKAEIALWVALKNRQLGVRFNRQKMINSYILDFYSKELKLGIEVDDQSHDLKYEYDQNRTSVLESFGIRVLRFTNNEVLTNREGVIEYLRKYIKQNYPPLPLPGGDESGI